MNLCYSPNKGANPPTGTFMFMNESDLMLFRIFADAVSANGTVKPISPVTMRANDTLTFSFADNSYATNIHVDVLANPLLVYEPIFGFTFFAGFWVTVFGGFRIIMAKVKKKAGRSFSEQTNIE